MNNRSLTAEAAAQFRDGINLVLSRWAALRMAVENDWGGRDSLKKPQQLADDLFYLLTQSKEKVYIEDVEDVLDEFMLSLNTEIGDNSDEEVAEKLMVMHEECLDGNFDSINKLRETNPPTVSYTRQHNGDDDEDSEADDGDNAMIENNTSEMEVDAPQCQSSLNQKDTVCDETNMKEVPEVADGWTVVSSRRSKGRKK
ncbi:hypothetical protein C2S51_028571 [Perilla frutescens var. frutescens]|nr:hypothetical protein C2S51_028571 [Perilla frutescens var. frutescens]